MSRLFGFLLLPGYLGATLIVGTLVHNDSLHENLASLAEAGQSRVDQAAERLVNQLDAYVVLTNLLARDGNMIQTLKQQLGAAEMSDLLANKSLTYGAERIDLYDSAGELVSSSAVPAAASMTDIQPLLTAALDGRLGLELRRQDGVRRVRFSRGVIVDTAPAVGAVIISVNIAALEFEWGFVPEAIAFAGADGVVIASNRPSLLSRKIGAAGNATRVPSGDTFWLGETVELLAFEQPSALPREALVVIRRVPRIGVTARGFLDVAPARENAYVRAVLAVAVMVLIGLAGLIIALWRRRLSDRLAFNEIINERLEARVEARTAELRNAQSQLIQASKMTALGEMSAGISHEMNQPLAAIMNFSQNGEKFLQLGRTEEAQQNFTEIGSQVARIDRIVRNLRGFARNEVATLEPVDFVECVQEALKLSEAALNQAGVKTSLELPGHAVPVMAGRVRLQQVVLNLLSNATDAMAESDSPLLELNLVTAEDFAVLSVRDRGHGIADIARLFEPFYTTRDLGSSKGLGLGLSISHGIIGSFGGEVSAWNRDGGGAVFSVRLPLTDPGVQQ